MKRRIRFVSVLAAIALSMFQTPAEACRVGGLVLQESLSLSLYDVVFVAEIVRVEPLEPGWEIVAVNVRERLKGEISTEASVKVRAGAHPSIVGLNNRHLIDQDSCAGHLGELFVFYARTFQPDREPSENVIRAPSDARLGELIAWATRFAADWDYELQQPRESE